MLDDDPTLLPPPKYTKQRADLVYGEAFRRVMEFVCCQPRHNPVGDVLEFGTLNGYTARKLAELMWELEHPGKLWCFDSFEGMPPATHEIDRASYEIQAGAWQPGTPRIRIPGVEVAIGHALADILTTDRVMLVLGWYEDTVARWFPQMLPPSIVHIDCDLYASTMTVLEWLKRHNLIRDGLVLLFDDWQSGRGNPNMGERAALRDSGINAEPWFSYGWSALATIVHV